MRYIIIEDWSTDHPYIAMNPMSSQLPMMFNTQEEAEQEANLYVDAIVVPLSRNLMVWEDTGFPENDWDKEIKL